MIIQSIVSGKIQTSCSKALFTDFNLNPSAEIDTGKQASAAIQLNVLDSTHSPRFQVQRVPKDLAIAPNRFYLSVELAGGSWTIPVQLTASEVEELLTQAAAMVQGGAE